MPEIAEVARIVHYLKKHAVGKTVESVKAQEDDIIFGKVGTSASAFKKAMTGKKIVDARQQGKYFWLVMDSPPHPLMHFGMTGWVFFSDDDNPNPKRPTKPEKAEWPPRFWKFVLQLKEDPKSEVAFIDARRLGRIRLVDAEAYEIRKTSPLKENGPDPVIDKDILTVEWLSKKLRSKKVPVKALLLDQANISGIGNWVGDEVMYQARLHPEQYSNTFSDEQIKRLHDAIMYVCDTAVEANGDSDNFPKDWLMKHRWGKGKKEGSKLPTGEKITFLKVGGRTSAIVPSVQKKTAAVAGDVSEAAEDEEADEDATPPKKGTKRKTKAVKEEPEAEAEEEPTTKPKRGRRNVGGNAKTTDKDTTEDIMPTRPKRVGRNVKEDVKDEANDDEKEAQPAKKRKTATSGTAKQGKSTKKEEVNSDDVPNRRRSGRNKP